MYLSAIQVQCTCTMPMPMDNEYTEHFDGVRRVNSFALDQMLERFSSMSDRSLALPNVVGRWCYTSSKSKVVCWAPQSSQSCCETQKCWKTHMNFRRFSPVLTELLIIGSLRKDFWNRWDWWGLSGEYQVLTVWLREGWGECVMSIGSSNQLVPGTNWDHGVQEIFPEIS